jgi:Zn-dependent peptidase ImmA (M78 family)
MEEVFSKRLKSARAMQRLSMDALCARMDNIISKQSISKYETGKMMPDSTVLIALANALQVSVDYLFRPFKTDLQSVEFRKKSKLKITALDSIKEKVRDSVERYLEIESILNMDSQFKIDFSNVIVHGADDVKNLVVRLRKEWNLGEDAISYVLSLLEENEIKVIELNAPVGFDGLSGWVNQSYPVIVLNKNFPAERKRFTAFHELGHLLLSFDPIIGAKEQESLCHLFASEMLLPSNQFIKLLGASRKDISLQELIDLQMQYGISIDALMYKAKELNIISEQRYKTYVIKKNTTPKFKDDANLSRFPIETSYRFRRLIYRSIASEIISLSKASVLLNAPIQELKLSLSLV